MEFIVDFCEEVGEAADAVAVGWLFVTFGPSVGDGGGAVRGAAAGMGETAAAGAFFGGFLAASSILDDDACV